MTRPLRLSAVLAAALLSSTAPAAQTTAVPRQSFVGTWVGTQRWAISTPPPGANQEQPVSVTIDIVNGKLTGTMTPFMGGEDGLVFSEGTIVGDELRAAARFGEPSPDKAPVQEDSSDQVGDFKVVPSNGRSRKQPWKDTIGIDLAFTPSGVSMKGKATVTMSGMTWLSFDYDLAKKRARY